MTDLSIIGDRAGAAPTTRLGRKYATLLQVHDEARRHGNFALMVGCSHALDVVRSRMAQPERKAA